MEKKAKMRKGESAMYKRRSYVRGFSIVMLMGILAVFFWQSMVTRAANADRKMKQEILDANSEQIASDREALAAISMEQEILAVVYPKITVNVFQEPHAESNVVGTLKIGASVMIRDLVLEATDSADCFGTLWNYVYYYVGDTGYWGYIEAAELLTVDERYLEWKEKAVLTSLAQMTFAEPRFLVSFPRYMTALPQESENTVSGGDQGNGGTGYEDIDLFPISYRQALLNLKQAHPTWMFVPYETNLDWAAAVANEIGDGKSLVHKSLADCLKEGAYDEGSWFYASEEALKYYMDPRNGLTEDRIFQFELLSFNGSCQTFEALDAFLGNTFMASANGNAPGTVMTYSRIIHAIGEEKGVSPFHLAARIYQEQGQGTSPLISGTVPGFEGYYNYMNIRASGKTQEEIIYNGLSYAKQENWYNAYYSIEGGTEIISQNYIRRQQDTLY